MLHSSLRDGARARARRREPVCAVWSVWRSSLEACPCRVALLLSPCLLWSVAVVAVEGAAQSVYAAPYVRLAARSCSGRRPRCACPQFSFLKRRDLVTTRTSRCGPVGHDLGVRRRTLRSRRDSCRARSVPGSSGSTPLGSARWAGRRTAHRDRRRSRRAVRDAREVRTLHGTARAASPLSLSALSPLPTSPHLSIATQQPTRPRLV